MGNRSTLTLDLAQSLFREDKSLVTSEAYQHTALEYAYDYMIGSEEYTAICLEIHQWLKSR